MTTSPYTPDTAAAIAGGSTSQGVCGNGNPVTWDAVLTRRNLTAIDDRAAAFAVDLRDNLALLRRDVRAGAAPVGTVRILGVGDSITIGTGSSDKTGWRGWLTDLLDRKHISAPISTCTVDGGTLRDIAPKVPAALTQYTPDIVLLNAGTNDAAQPDLTDWQARYGTLVDQILAYSPTVKVACARVTISRTSWSANETTINGYVDAVVSARKSGGRVVSADMTAISSSWTVDDVHPLDAGYLRMAQIWQAAIGPWLPAAP